MLLHIFTSSSQILWTAQIFTLTIFHFSLCISTIEVKKSQINSNVCGAGPVRFYVSSVLDWGRVGLRFSFGIGPSAGILIPLFHYYYFTSIIKIFARGECESHKVLLWKNNNGTVPQALRAPLTWQSFSYDAGFVDGTFNWQTVSRSGKDGDVA